MYNNASDISGQFMYMIRQLLEMKLEKLRQLQAAQQRAAEERREAREEALISRLEAATDALNGASTRVGTQPPTGRTDGPNGPRYPWNPDPQRAPSTDFGPAKPSSPWDPSPTQGAPERDDPFRDSPGRGPGPNPRRWSSEDDFLLDQHASPKGRAFAASVRAYRAEAQAGFASPERAAQMGAAVRTRAYDYAASVASSDPLAAEYARRTGDQAARGDELTPLVNALAAVQVQRPQEFSATEAQWPEHRELFDAARATAHETTRHWDWDRTEPARDATHSDAARAQARPTGPQDHSSHRQWTWADDQPASSRPTGPSRVPAAARQSTPRTTAPSPPLPTRRLDPGIGI